MNKAILMSIQPKWLVKILNGEKTIQIRKTMPKCDLPVDVYLYCTKGKTMLCDFGDNEFPYKNGGYELSSDLINIKNHDAKILNGKVVAKFTLNKCYELEFDGEDWNTYYWKNTIISGTELERKSCLTQCDMEEYAGGKNIYAWHMDNLVIFDKPMELREFSTFKRETIHCGMDCPPYKDWVEYRVRKAPQSWQYAYVGGETK